MFPQEYCIEYWRKEGKEKTKKEVQKKMTIEQTRGNSKTVGFLLKINTLFDLCIKLYQ